MFFKKYRSRKKDQQEKITQNKWENDKLLFDTEKKRIKELAQNISEEIKIVYNKRIDENLYHIKAGDTAVLNKYTDVSFSSWDGGPNILLYHDNETESLGVPYTVIIKELRPNFSLVDEKIYRIFERYDYDQLKKVNHAEISKIIKENVYVNAFFETPTSFKPVWGLSIDSFLKIDSVLGLATIELWKKEIHVWKLKKEINSELSIIRDEEIKIKSEINLLKNKK